MPMKYALIGVIVAVKNPIAKKLPNTFVLLVYIFFSTYPLKSKYILAIIAPIRLKNYPIVLKKLNTVISNLLIVPP